MGDRGLDELPRGIVTFLMTDVEGSTPLWEQRPDEMVAAMVRHHEILREVIHSFGGGCPQEQGEGDSVVGAFPAASSAVRAAVAAQVRLGAELAWLPVRMGLHTGEAHFRDERNYAGPTIIRAARLRSCAHGRQILASSITAGIVATERLADTSLRHLGEVHLKGLDRPEQAWQVVHPDIPDDFPALATVEAVRTNVPAAASTFVGREDDRRSVMASIRRARVVTVTGSGGCGKTRLVQEIAPALAADHPGGVWWVELAALTSGALIAEHVAASCGVEVRPQSDAVGALVDHFDGRGPTVLVLDNVEHVVGECAELCATLLERCADVRVLATGREPLMMDGETVWRVPSLAVPPEDGVVDAAVLLEHDATRLFVERARDALPTIRIDDHAAARVASICRRLDGIPLAIELAAARIRTLPLDRLASGLDDTFRLLDAGSRSRLERHRTLAASIRWSVEQLGQEERRALSALSVFAGPFSLDAAISIMASRPPDAAEVEHADAVDVLTRLVDKSLVLFLDEEGRYRLLETVRAFAFEELTAAGRVDEARRHHAEWFAAWCEQVDRGVHGLVIAPRRAEIADVLTALDWSMRHARTCAYRILRGLGWAWPQLGRFADAERWMTWLAAQDMEEDGPIWAAAVAGVCLLDAGRQRDVRALVERADPYLERIDIGAQRLFAWYHGTRAMMFQGDVDILEAAFDDAVRDRDVLAARRLGDIAALGREMRGEFASVQAIAAQLAPLLAAFGSSISASTACGVHTGLINATCAAGRLAEARRMVLDSSRPEPLSAVHTATAAAKLGWWTGDPELVALGAEIVGTDLARVLRAPAGLIDHIAARMEGRHDEALDAIVWVHHQYVITPAVRSHVSDFLHLALIEANRIDEAAAYADAHAEDVERTGRPVAGIVTVVRTQAWLSRARGDVESWRTQGRHVVDVARRAGLALVEIDGIELVASAIAQGTDRGRAATMFASTERRRREIGYPRRFVPGPDRMEQLAAELAREHPDAGDRSSWPIALA